MAGQANDMDEGITGINVTPLVDIMLVLLIIFMVTANYINAQAIKVELPKASSGDPSDTTNLAFVIDKDSNIYLDGTFIEIIDLDEKIKSYKDSTSKVQALIGADKATPHGTVIKVIDKLRTNGIVDFALNIEAE